MKLTEWMDKMGLSQAETAKLVGTDQPHISNLAAGKVRPTVSTIERIHKVTKGEVSYPDFLFPKKTWKKPAVKTTKRGER